MFDHIFAQLIEQEQLPWGVFYESIGPIFRRIEIFGSRNWRTRPFFPEK
jgi:hypothetical protein